MQKILEKTFTVCLVLSVTIVFILILAQAIGLIIGNGGFMIQANNLLLTPAIVLAAIFSGIAFILGYFPEYKE
ncbi:hypothetical protein JTF04_07525 [Mammaliicoccus vitulinus]|uniref:hypothetical protein n=1 Tax=Mammaliicoccus vitulinus TaxID=71237 RepID=UPI0003137ACC|nr:hypothetical protein [Mammaliicoccus vitulinus]MBM6629530.1 hypothetical protein [Mammaliicoccus vitulinus]MBO3078403.1 hypothetical protein [Mammaliicoccus vitulinus]WQK88177.1 hypothetical protein P3U62_01205 [Mammaliicoccus vitulinus]